MYSITQIYRHGVYEKAPFTKYQQDDQGGHRVLKAQSALLGSQKEGGLVWGRGFALANAKIRQVQAVPYSQAHPLGYPRCYCHLRCYFYPGNRELQLNCSTLSLACKQNGFSSPTLAWLLNSGLVCHLQARLPAARARALLPWMLTTYFLFYSRTLNSHIFYLLLILLQT